MITHFHLGQLIRNFDRESYCFQYGINTCTKVHYSQHSTTSRVYALLKASLTNFSMNHSKPRHNRIGDIEGSRRASELFGFLRL